jgi:PAS domain S-box-containing protein
LRNTANSHEVNAGNGNVAETLWHWEQDPRGYYTYSDEGVAALLGYTVDEVLGRHYSDFLSHEQSASFFCEGDDDSLEAFKLINRYRHKDGREIAAESVGEPIFHPDGALVKWQGVDRVITTAQRWRIEEELRRSRTQARVFARRLESAIETERIAIAREIHDELGQLLSGLKFDLRWLQRRLNTVPTEANLPAFQGKLSFMLGMVDAAMLSLRRIVTDLRPAALDTLGLAETIDDHARHFQERTGLACTIRLDPEVELDQDRAIAVFRIYQEAMTNIARHSEATKVEIDLARQAGSVFLKVHDNGTGITDKQTNSVRSLGIVGMHERARMLRGTVTVQGRPQGGTTVQLLIPAQTHREGAQSASAIFQ